MLLTRCLVLFLFLLQLSNPCRLLATSYFSSQQQHHCPRYKKCLPWSVTHRLSLYSCRVAGLSSFGSVKQFESICATLWLGQTKVLMSPNRGALSPKRLMMSSSLLLLCWSRHCRCTGLVAVTKTADGSNAARVADSAAATETADGVTSVVCDRWGIMLSFLAIKWPQVNAVSLWQNQESQPGCRWQQTTLTVTKNLNKCN